MADERREADVGRVCAACGQGVEDDEDAPPFNRGWAHARCVYLLPLGFQAIIHSWTNPAANPSSRQRGARWIELTDADVPDVSAH